MALPSGSKERKELPVCTGVLDYFPDAIAEVAQVSKQGNDQHNPGEPLHWAREKSADHADCIARHLLERGTQDVDGMRHSAKLAWRALALLQVELETGTVTSELDQFTVWLRKNDPVSSYAYPHYPRCTTSERHMLQCELYPYYRGTRDSK